MSIPSFDYAGLSFIAWQFDQKHGLLPRPEIQKGRAVVIHQLQRHFQKTLPTEVINIIFQHHLNAISANLDPNRSFATTSNDKDTGSSQRQRSPGVAETARSRYQ